MADPRELELIERLARIETKIDNFQETQKVTNENSHFIIELREHYVHQQKEIDEIKDNNKWLSRAVMGAIITSVVGIVFIVIRTGIGI